MNSDANSAALHLHRLFATFDIKKVDQMKKFILIFLLATAQLVSAQPTILDAITRKVEDGTAKYSINFKIMDQVSDRIAIHAREYPPTFETPKQEKKIRNELKSILELLDILYTDELNDPNLLIRIGSFHSMGHNLDFPKSPEKAKAAFDKLLSIEPDNPKGNYLYGMFLSSTAKYQNDSIKFLKKALELGVQDAKYTLGLIHLKNGNSKIGISYLEDYSKQYPKSRASMILKAHKEGKLKFNTNN